MTKVTAFSIAVVKLGCYYNCFEKVEEPHLFWERGENYGGESDSSLDLWSGCSAYYYLPISHNPEAWV